MEVDTALKKITREIMMTKLSRYHRQPLFYILQKYIFDKGYEAFEGSFSAERQETFLPSSFKLFTDIFLPGIFIDSRKEKLEQPMLINLPLIACKIKNVHKKKVHFIIFLKLENPRCLCIYGCSYMQKQGKNV